MKNCHTRTSIENSFETSYISRIIRMREGQAETLLREAVQFALQEIGSSRTRGTVHEELQDRTHDCYRLCESEIGRIHEIVDEEVLFNEREP